MKRIVDADVEQAVKQIANYYRNSRLYTSLFNTDDAYGPYIRELSEDTRLIVQQGHSYRLKDEFVIGIRLEQFEQEHPEAYHHYFDCIASYLKPVINREPEDVIFICALGPSEQFCTKDTYKLIKEFVDEYGKQYTIITDCPVDIDFQNFAEITGSRKILIAGMEYFRWVRRK